MGLASLTFLFLMVTMFPLHLITLDDAANTSINAPNPRGVPRLTQKILTFMLETPLVSIEYCTPNVIVYGVNLNCSCKVFNAMSLKGKNITAGYSNDKLEPQWDITVDTDKNFVNFKVVGSGAPVYLDFVISENIDGVYSTVTSTMKMHFIDPKGTTAAFTSPQFYGAITSTDITTNFPTDNSSLNYVFVPFGISNPNDCNGQTVCYYRKDTAVMLPGKYRVFLNADSWNRQWMPWGPALSVRVLVLPVLYFVNGVSTPLSFVDASDQTIVPSNAFPTGYLVHCADGVRDSAACAALSVRDERDAIVDSRFCKVSAGSRIAVGRGAAKLSAARGVYVLCAESANGGVAPAALLVRVVSAPFRVTHAVLSSATVRVAVRGGDVDWRAEDYGVCVVPSATTCDAAAERTSGSLGCAESGAPNAPSVDVEAADGGDVAGMRICVIARRAALWDGLYPFAVDGGAVRSAPPNGGLSGGGIAGVVVGVAVGAALALVGHRLLCGMWPWQRCGAAKDATATVTGAPAADGTSADGEGGNPLGSGAETREESADRDSACSADSGRLATAYREGGGPLVRPRSAFHVFCARCATGREPPLPDSADAGSGEAVFGCHMRAVGGGHGRGGRPGDTFRIPHARVALLAHPLHRSVRVPRAVDLVVAHPLFRVAAHLNAFHASARRRRAAGGGAMARRDVRADFCRDLEHWQGSRLVGVSRTSPAGSYVFCFQQSLAYIVDDFFEHYGWRAVAAGVMGICGAQKRDLRLATLYTRFLSEAERVFAMRGRRLTVSDVSAEFRAVLELWQGSHLTDVQWSAERDTYIFAFCLSAVMYHRHYFYPRTDIPPEGYLTTPGVAVVEEM